MKIQNSLGSQKLHENEFNTIYCVGVYKNDKKRLANLKLLNQMTRKRHIKLRNNFEKEIDIYINTDKTKSELEKHNK